VTGKNDGDLPDLIFLLLNFNFDPSLITHRSPFIAICSSLFTFLPAVCYALSTQQRFCCRSFILHPSSFILALQRLSPTSDGVSRTRHQKIIFSLARKSVPY